MFWSKRRNQQPTVIVHTQTKYVTKPEDVALRSRVDEYLENAELEYARLGQIVHQELNRRDAGKLYHQEDITRGIAQMSTIIDSMSAIKGTDRIMESCRLDKLAQSKRGAVFPMTSFLSGLTPLYASA